METTTTTAGLGSPGSRALLAFAMLTTTSVTSSCRRIASAPGAPEKVDIENAGTWAGLRVRTVGERRNPRQVVVLLHGWGAPGDDLVPLGDELVAPGRLFVFPAAPLVSPGGGRAWWHLDMARLMAARESGAERDLRQETPAGLSEARAQVTALIAEVTRRARVAPASVIIGGFSQGAMLATDVALASPAAVGGLVVMSGSVVSEAAWTARLATVPPGFAVFQSHGRGDPVLPFGIAEALRDLLRAAGDNVTWVPFDGGHQIPPVVLAGVRTFLAARAPGGTPSGS